MSNTGTSGKLILLSKLISRLNDIEYYQTFAKSLIKTTNSNEYDSINGGYIEQMFHYFIDNENLEIYLNDKIINRKDFTSFSDLISQSNGNHCNNNAENFEWKNDIYINLSDLKKLYANKCIVFPVSLTKELENS